MPPGYIDGQQPVYGSYLNASVGVVTPEVQQTASAKTVTVPQPANNDTMAVLTSTQTLSSKTLIGPVISSGNWYLGSFTQPVISSGNWANASLTAPTIDRLTNTIMGGRVFKTAAVGTAKTLDMATADIYLVQLTCSSVLTVSNCPTGKTYQMIVQQNITNSYTAVTYPSGFINGFVDSGVTQHTGAVDFWTVTYDGSKHYAVGVKDIQ